MSRRFAPLTGHAKNNSRNEWMEPPNEFRPSQFVAPAEAGDNEIFRRHRLIIHDWMGPSKVRHCNSLGFRCFTS